MRDMVYGNLHLDQMEQLRGYKQMDNELVQIENSLSLSKGIPKQIKLLPLGLVVSEKGNFLVDDESYSSIFKRFKDRQLDIPVDYEHQTLTNAQAPAAGWIKSLSLKTDGIYGDVEWTEKAEQYLKNKEYRYLSPVVNVRITDRKALLLHSVALTNTPAINGMTAVVNATKDNGVIDISDPDNEGDATDKFVRNLKNMLQLPETASLSDIENAISEAIQNQIKLKLEIDTTKFELHKQRIDDTVTQALKSGKLLPYQSDWAFRSAMTDLNEFTLWLKEAPMVVPMGSIDFEIPQKESSSKAQKLLDISEDDYKKYR